VIFPDLLHCFSAFFLRGYVDYDDYVGDTPLVCLGANGSLLLPARVKLPPNVGPHTVEQSPFENDRSECESRGSHDGNKQ